MSAKTVLAIDPGSHKCGMALVKREEQGQLTLVWRAVVPKEMVIPKMHEAYVHDPYQLVIIGSSTGSKDVVNAVRNHLPGLGTLVVDEKETTIQARERYWEHNPRRGWRKLLPASLQVPPTPYDDFAALILAERVLSEG